MDSVQSAVNAEAGGASRVELCSSLVEGGTTPSLGMLRTVKAAVKIPVFAMIRPRGGDFLYSDVELKVMKEDLILMKENGADGIVFGILTADGRVDAVRTREFLKLSHPLPVTFHRAFDVTRDLEESLEVLIELGVRRVLTSGGESSALEGIPTLEKLVEKGKDRILVVPGGGIHERNLSRILLGCKAMEFHGSARTASGSAMEYRKANVSMGATFGPSEFAIKTANRERVAELLSISGQLKN